jgi:hypothetical protein
MSDGRTLPLVAQSRGVPHKRTRLSVLWIIPIVAAAAGLWVAVARILSEGPDVTIYILLCGRNRSRQYQDPVPVASCCDSAPSKFYSLSSTSTPSGVSPANITVLVAPISIPAAVPAGVRTANA